MDAVTRNNNKSVNLLKTVRLSMEIVYYKINVQLV